MPPIRRITSPARQVTPYANPLDELLAEKKRDEKDRYEKSRVEENKDSLILELDAFDPVEADWRRLRTLFPAFVAREERLHKGDKGERVIDAACNLLRIHLTKVEPWPGCANRRTPGSGFSGHADLAMELWSKIGRFEAPGGIYIKRIFDRTPQFRDQVCDKAIDLVIHAYGFVDIRNVEMARKKKKIITENHAKYKALMNTFYYENPNNMTIPDTVYRHPIIQDVLNAVWFGEGVYARSKYFADDTELPLVTIAFILTVVENALDAWSSGDFKRVKFKYYRQYTQHLDRLKKWKESCANEPHDMATELQVSLLQNARLSESMVEDSESDSEDEDSGSDSWSLRSRLKYWL